MTKSRHASIPVRFQVTLLFLLTVALAALLCGTVHAEDWPTFRHDNARSASTPEQLPAKLTQQWVFVPRHAPDPAWTEPAKEKPRVRFDEAFHVAAVGDAVYFGSSANGKVYCLDGATGQVRWSAITGGPVRVAPTVADGRVYVGSDDGHAYCLQATDGALVWRMRASFRPDKVVGNGDMISLWPVRTGVLVDKGVAYFGAGVFPHESIFLCAVDAATGNLLWCNDTCGEEGYKLEFGGISPQGPLLASESTLFVPSSRAMPAAFDRATGAFRYYFPPGGKVGGTWALLTHDRLVAGVEAKRAYDMEKGKMVHDAAYAWFPGLHLVCTDDYAYMLNFEELVALDRKSFGAASEWRGRVAEEEKPLTNRSNKLKQAKRTAKGDALRAIDEELATLGKQLAQLAAERKGIEDAVHRWRRPCPNQDALVLAGGQLYVGGDGAIGAANATTGEDMWTAPVQGRACGLAAANQRLFVSTDNGRIYCFGSGETVASEVTETANGNPYPDDAATKRCADLAERVVTKTGIKKGFCLVYGSGTGRLAYELAKRTEMKIVGVDPDPAKVATAIAALDQTGLYGARITIEQGDMASLPHADYFANLVVSETMLDAGGSADLAEALRCVKPCGGVLYVERAGDALAPPRVDAVRAWAADQAEVETGQAADGTAWLKLTRGPLPGAGKWTHLYADAANTACSDDQRVKGALGTLWFGEPGPERMVERHARAAGPVAMDGRLFVQGENVIMAYDSYNGVLLWRREVPGALRVRVDSDMSNLALTRDGLYVASGAECIRLNPATGDVMHTYRLTPDADGSAHRWGYLACLGDTLFGSFAEPLANPYGSEWFKAQTGPSETPSFENTARLLADDRPANPRDFWDYERAGKMWHSMMSSWPAWGSVETPVGAVTERILASDIFFAMDTATGDLRWSYQGEAIAHPAVAIADDTVFLADCGISADEKLAAMAERETLIANGVWEKEDITYGPADADVRRVVALDVRTGEKRWERVLDLTGCGGDRMGLAFKDGVLCFFGCFSNHDRGLFKDGKLAWRRITAIAGKDGGDMWSRPLNYLRRPLIVGDEILIEPRACSLQTGAIKTRPHPLTGAESTWEFVRPGHCCSITSAAPAMFFLRGYFLWYYDVMRDQGMLPYGAIRPGCWINVVPANGLVLFPEASAGCTCSYPVRSTVVLQPKEQQETWSFLVQHGPMTPVKHMAVNFGAPGDWRHDDGTLWFGYPHPPSTGWQTYGCDFKLNETFVAKPAYYIQNFKGIDVKGSDKPWLLASGSRGMTGCTLPLLDAGQGPAQYTVRLHFMESESVEPGQRVFDVKLQGATVHEGLDIRAEAGGTNVALVKTFEGIAVTTGLQVELVPKAGEPILCGIEAVREDVKVAKTE
jgi:outer membrane protein assembly factor BamB